MTHKERIERTLGAVIGRFISPPSLQGVVEDLKLLVPELEEIVEEKENELRFGLDVAHGDVLLDLQAQRQRKLNEMALASELLIHVKAAIAAAEELRV